MKLEESELGTFNYEYDESTGMLKKVIKDEEVIKTFTYVDTILIKLTDNDIMYDRYGNITKIGDIEITYNFRGLMDSYTIPDTSNSTKKYRYKYYYNYQGVRYKKEKYEVVNVTETLKEQTIYYLNGSTILGEDIIGETGVVDKFRYYYDAEGICGIKYNNKNYVLIKDTLGNISKVLCNGIIMNVNEILDYISDECMPVIVCGNNNAIIKKNLKKANIIFIF